MSGGAASTWKDLFNTHRQRLARLVLVVAALAIGLSLWSEVPRETAVEFALGDGHGQVQEVHVRYLRDGEVYHGARFDFPAGAPQTVPHRVSLPAGQYEIQLDVFTASPGDARHSQHPLTTPADGLVRIRVR